MRILAATPIEDEFDALTTALRGLGYAGQQTPIGWLSTELFGGLELYVAQGGLGKAQFGIQTQHLIDRLDGLDLAVCAGTAGGLHDALSIGDVVVGSVTIEHDFKWGMATKPVPRFEGDQHLISKLFSALPALDLPFTTHFGPIASGDEGVADSVRARELHEQTGALVVAWEGAGGARSAQFSGVPFLEIRGVSDGSGESASTEFKENIPLAMRNVAMVLEFLAQIPS